LGSSTGWSLAKLCPQFQQKLAFAGLAFPQSTQNKRILLFQGLP
jgi:hypothetical protein